MSILYLELSYFIMCSCFANFSKYVQVRYNLVLLVQNHIKNLEREWYNYCISYTSYILFLLHVESRLQNT